MSTPARWPQPAPDPEPPRPDPTGGLLGPLRATALTLGNVGVPALANVMRGAGSGGGLVLSNRPLNQPSSYGLHTLRGELPPGRDVTLYFNDARIGLQPSRADGCYAGKGDVGVQLFMAMGATRARAHGCATGSPWRVRARCRTRRLWMPKCRVCECGV